MPDRPIVLTADEVRETLAGRMSHILRPVTINPYDGAFYLLDGWPHRSKDGESPRIDGKDEPYPCPGAVGDRLWVRETWGVGTRPDPFTGCRDGVEYRADEGLLQEGEALPLRSVEPPTGVDLDAIRPGWHSSTSMPRWASRLSLDVVAVRVARLDEITDEQIMAAGVPLAEDMRCGGGYPGGAHSYQDRGETVRCPICNGLGYESRVLRDALRTAWNLRYVERAPASSNPWIWDITVKRVED